MTICALNHPAIGMHAGCKEVRAVLARLNADSPIVDAVAVGHTAGWEVRISCGRSLLCADSSLGRWYHLYGNLYCSG
jgi:hypothetical protein